MTPFPFAECLDLSLPSINVIQVSDVLGLSEGFVLLISEHWYWTNGFSKLNIAYASNVDMRGHKPHILCSQLLHKNSPSGNILVRPDTLEQFPGLRMRLLSSTELEHIARIFRSEGFKFAYDYPVRIMEKWTSLLNSLVPIVPV